MAEYREQRYTAQDGLSLYFRDYGDGRSHRTPVICLPGLTRNSKDFHAVAIRLAADRRVICPDYRGRGRSDYDTNSDNYQPTTYLNDIRHLLVASGIHRVVVLGTSLGGILGMGMGAAMPTALAGVIMNDVGPEVGTDGLLRILEYVRQDRPQPDWEGAVAELKRMFPNMPGRTDEDWRMAAEGTYRAGEDGMLHFDWDVRIAEPILNGPPPPDLWPLFRSLLHVPTLVLRGELSDVLTSETLSKMKDAHPAAVTVTVPRTGHVPTLGEPESAAAIDDFLANF